MATVKLVSAPISVILGWLPVAIVPDICVPVIVPAVTVPVTLNDVSVPIAVILLWVDSVTVPAARENAGTRLAR